jgi:hypothetical protein
MASSRHKPRRSHISGKEGVRARARRIARSRSHGNFTKFLSGYDSNGAASGPYTGVRILDEEARHMANDDETRPDFAGNFSKGLEHDDLKTGTGFVDSMQYKEFRNALTTVLNNARLDPTLPDPGSVEAIDQILRALENKRPFVNPLGGVATDLEGLDPLDIAVPPAPPFNGDVAAAEMMELYWMALMRDIDFADWATNGMAAKAVDELNKRNADLSKEGRPFALHYEKGAPNGWSPTITLERLFRGSASGNEDGGYISQFLLHDVPFGTIDFEQKQFFLEIVEKNGEKFGRDYLVSEDDWTSVQRGGASPGFPAEPGRMDLEIRDKSKPLCEQKRRHITTLRDLAHYVHFDALHEAYFNAALILDSLRVKLNPTNIYLRPPEEPRRERKQTGFGTFGGPHILVLLTEVATRALKAVWHQKWYVHRRLRPEVLGARAHLAKQPGGSHTSLVHQTLLDSDALKDVNVSTMAVTRQTHISCRWPFPRAARCIRPTVPATLRSRERA